MDEAQRSAYLSLFSHAGKVYQKWAADPLWRRYPNVCVCKWDSLGLFLEGFAFERQGTSPSYSQAAAHVISEAKENGSPLEANAIWERFGKELGNVSLNIKNSPLAPKDTPLNSGSTAKVSQYSVIELAVELNEPLVEWARVRLEQNRIDEIYQKLVGITGTGEKLASYFLSDLACQYPVFPDTHRELLQPIDVWVRRAADLLGADGRNHAEFIVKGSLDNKLVPEMVNRGMWYFGAEIVGSEYLLRRALKDLSMANDLLEEHCSILRNAGNALPKRSC